SASPATAAPAPARAQSLAPAPVDDGGQPDLFSMLEDAPDPAFAAQPDDSLAVVVELERELLDPAVRADPLRAGELLHPDFEEIGASGRRWSRQEILAMFSDEEAASTSLEVLTLNRLDAATTLLTYRSAGSAGSALRSSIWQLENGRWQVRFHQGTPES
ncbi:MAG: nuclear transport factor 2 family protein, partial [Specibacter sp.]